MKAQLREVLRRCLATGAACAAPMLLALCLGAQLEARAQAPASVSGEVTDGERGLAGVVVALFSFERGARSRLAARTRTDSEGRYRFDGVRPGRYHLLPHAPALIAGERGGGWPAGAKIVSVLAGDSIEDVDFRLTRGGVVTGRVTGADGQPIIGESINLVPERNTGEETRPVNPSTVTTDDRGIYRAYGLAPGRYRISVGGPTRPGGSRRPYPRTFHPDAIDEARAAVVEVAAGGEAENIDISVGRPVRTFKASGRVVSAETGQPAAGMRVGVGAVDPSGRRVTSYTAGGLASGPRGEFVVDNLAPGRYAAFLAEGEGGGWYSDPVIFNLGSADKTGLELKLKRGASVSGTVLIEGIGDRATLARLLRDVQVIAFNEPDGNLLVPRQPASAPATDGTFYLSGLRPGKLRINVMPRAPGLAVTRVEAGGVEVSRTGVQLAEGAQLSGVRVVLVYGTGIIRGQVSLEGGNPPPNTRVVVAARRVGSEPAIQRQTAADARGRFQLEGLPAGTYEVRARAFGPDPRGQRFESRPQQIFVADGAEQQILLTIEPTVAAPSPPASVGP